MSDISSILLICLVDLLILPVLMFDPFMDNHPYSISWGGPLEFNKEEIELLGDRHVLVTTNNQERYQCVLPKGEQDKKDGGNKYTGPSATELLGPLFLQTECSYRIESYWNYELCHGKHLKQYHESKESSAGPAKLQEYFLGYGNQRDIVKGNDQAEDTGAPLPVKELEGEELPYYEVVMSDGTKCDLTDQPRKAHILYVCFKDGRGEVYQLKEISTCEYEVVVLTSRLCKHPKYKPKVKAVNEIRCHAFLGSPIKPSHLIYMEHENKFFHAVGQDFVVPDLEPEPKVTNEKEKPVPTPTPEPEVLIHRKAPETPDPTRTAPTRLGAITDKQTLRDFFKGHKCLRGGHGWWKHEICYGKYAKQFHVENGKEISIYLGFWDTENHIQWLKKNPLKRPKDLSVRKYVSQMYMNGDACDLTGKGRSCEVRLKCIDNTKNPHAVMLSLAEPSPCQYVLTVESALFCPIMKNANTDGLFEELDL